LKRRTYSSFSALLSILPNRPISSPQRRQQTGTKKLIETITSSFWRPSLNVGSPVKY
jgi:hypothetical protein